jgi:hypothetical protein
MSAKEKALQYRGFQAQRQMNSGHDLKNFNAHSGHAAISDSQRARRAGRPSDASHFERWIHEQEPRGIAWKKSERGP